MPPPPPYSLGTQNFLMPPPTSLPLCWPFSLPPSPPRPQLRGQREDGDCGDQVFSIAPTPSTTTTPGGRNGSSPHGAAALLGLPLCGSIVTPTPPHPSLVDSSATQGKPFQGRGEEVCAGYACLGVGVGGGGLDSAPRLWASL